MAAVRPDHPPSRPRAYAGLALAAMILLLLPGLSSGQLPILCLSLLLIGLVGVLGWHRPRVISALLITVLGLAIGGELFLAFAPAHRIEAQHPPAELRLHPGEVLQMATGCPAGARPFSADTTSPILWAGVLWPIHASEQEPHFLALWPGQGSITIICSRSSFGTAMPTELSITVAAP